MNRGSRGLQYGAGDDREVQCGFGLFAAVKRALAMVRHESVPHGGLLKCVSEPYTIFSVLFQSIETLSIVRQLGPKILQAFVGFFLFGWDELLLRHFCIVL